MPGATVPFGFPYPLPTDPTNGPGDIKALAEAVDAAVTSTEAQLAALTDPPAAWMGGGPQAIPNALGTVLLFSSEFFDNASMIDLASDPTIITITSAGFYLVSAEVGFEANGTGGRQLEFLLNGAPLENQSSSGPPTVTSGWSVNVSVMRSFVAGDKISCRAGHTAGPTITTTGVEFQVIRMSV